MDKDVVDLTAVLCAAVSHQASDIVLKAGHPPMFRVRGDIIPCPDASALTAEALQTMAGSLLRTDSHRMRFATERQVDLAFDEPAIGRFRAHVFRQRGTVSMVFRVIPPRVFPVAELNLPPIVEKLAGERRGLILVTGSTGSGKTTTLAAMLDTINRSSARHIVTVEDPVEYIHTEHSSIISQREIGEDVNDFPSALEAALRQNPDVIMVGELRDRSTMETAIMAAETGHLVMSTLHTADAPLAIMRMIATFPEHQREQIRVMLACVLLGVISQRLIQGSDGTGLVPAVEVMVGTLRVREYIEKQRIRELPELIAQGQSYGMQTFDQSLLALYRAGRISYADALAHCRNPSELEMQVQGLTSGDRTLTSVELHAVG